MRYIFMCGGKISRAVTAVGGVARESAGGPASTRKYADKRLTASPYGPH